MKKSAEKSVKKSAFLAVAAVMPIFLAACGSSNSTAVTQTVNATGDGTGKSPAVPAAAAADKPVITFMTIDFTGNSLKNEGSDTVIAMYEEHTGIRVDWRFEADDTYKEKLGLVLMDRANMPMVITDKGEMTSNIVDAANKGAFWDLGPFLEDSEAFPNLSQANKEILKGFTVNGQVIGLYRQRHLGRYGFSYRRDWAEKVGITKDPETAEGVYEMMYKFTYEDPDGNGKNDTFGLEMTKYTGPFDVIQTWFGVGNQWVIKDGKLTPAHMTEEYMEALNWIKKCYDDGLLRRDWATIDSSTFGQALQKGEAGCFVDVMDGGRRAWDYFEKNGVMSVTDPSVYAAISLVGPINGVTLATTGHNGYYLITRAGAKTEEDVRNCLTFLDKMCDDEMIILADHGLEGINYYLEGDRLIKIPAEVDGGAPSQGLNQSLCYIPNILPVNPQVQLTVTTQAEQDAYKKNEKVAVFNPAVGYLANSEANAEFGRDVAQIIDDARTQYVCGQIDRAGLDRAVQQWLDRGGQAIIDEVNQLYEADPDK